MKTPKINLSFTKYNDATFENKAAHILSSMTDNSNFPTPVPALTTVQAALTQYSTDLLAAATLDRTSVAQKNQSRESLEELLMQLGMSVMTVANGDTAMLVSSGYPLSKQPEPSYITSPGNVILDNGVTSGQMVAKVKTVPGAKSYLYQIATQTPAEDTSWVSTSSSRSKFTFSNLVPGKQYWVRVAVTGRGEQITYSNVASQFAQ